MCTIDYEAEQRRLRVAGTCRDTDAEQIRDAIDVFGRRGDRLIVDLTGLTDLDHGFATAVLGAIDELHPRQVTVLRKHGSEVDRLLCGDAPV